MKKKYLSIVLAMSMVASLAACGNNTPAPAETTAPAATEAATTEATEESVEEVVDLSTMSYDDASSYLYEKNLGDFYAAYQDALENSSSVSERHAKQALAEAKLMEAAVMLPLYCSGGNYQISKIAYGTSTSVLWGNDDERFHNRLITTELIKVADRNEMKAKWAELKGTGTYYDWAKEFLAEKGYELKDSYSLGYGSDPKTWDVLATSRAADSEAIINTYDGLMEYDCENVLKPALAESYEVSEDGLTYTFHIRQGATWVDSQGRKVDDVKADDFVAGMQHMMDAMGGLEFLVDGIIVGANGYINNEITDFAEVGVKAVDDYTLVYSLEKPCFYFPTMLGYGLFAPMSRSYFESQGGKFGADYDASATDYKYGTTPDNIAYCGPYVVTNATANNTIVFSANESYWNAENVQNKKITWYFNDNTDVLKAYNDTKAGILDGCGLSTAVVPQAKEDGLFDDYAAVSGTDATSYMAFLNMNRAAFANVSDEKAAVSAQTEEDGARTSAALQNVHFRRAVTFSLDRANYRAQSVGDDLKYVALRNCYTPGTFAQLEEDVTVSVNGTDTTFKAGTYYGEIMQAQIDADGVTIKVWDPTQDAGIGSSDGFDGWYNVDAARAELETAIAELSAQGVEISAENPILLDLPFMSASETRVNMSQAFAQSVADALEGKVVVNLVDCADADQWYGAGYYTDYGYEANYNIYDLSGWGPDYGDPQTYLDTFLPDYAGYMIKCIGIF